MIYHDIQVSSREMNLGSSVVGRGGVWLQAGNGTALRGTRVRARAKTDTRTLRHTFDSSFPSRLCAKLAPMVKWRRGGRSMLVEEDWAPSSGRRPRPDTSRPGTVV